MRPEEGGKSLSLTARSERRGPRAPKALPLYFLEKLLSIRLRKPYPKPTQVVG